MIIFKDDRLVIEIFSSTPVEEWYLLSDELVKLLQIRDLDLLPDDNFYYVFKLLLAMKPDIDMCIDKLSNTNGR